MPESRFPPIALLTLLISCLCIYGIILQPGITFAGMDFLNLGYPRVMLARDALSQGHLPLWNWYEWGGAPLLASMLGALLYPPTWLAMLLPLPFGLQFFVFTHLLLAGVGAFAVGRRVMHFSTPAAVLCGIFYMGNSFFPGRIEQFQVIAVNALFPWLVLSLDESLLKQRSAAWAAVTWCATLLAGHPQFAVFNFLGASAFIGLIILARLVQCRQSTTVSPTRSFTSRLLVTGAALVLGTFLAAMQLLPTWELGSLSERIWPYPDPTHPQLEWHHLPSLIIPSYYNMLTAQSGRVFGFTELGLYAGILAVPLAITGIVSAVRGSHGRTPIFAAVAVWLTAMLFSLGTSGGLASLVFEYVPFFTQSRGAARSLNVAALMLALMAGRGIMAILQLKVFSVRPRQQVAALILGALIVTDLSVNYFSALKSALVPVEMLSPSLLLSKPLRQSLQTSRLYRLMAFDSDIYLNNSPAAVAERVIRLQPNMNSLAGISLVDGYEEGLLPRRTTANLWRKYNRNLRGDSPDSALLAFLGANIMLTEYPISPGQSWQRASPPFPRPTVVPDLMGQPAAYSFWKSNYEPARFLDLYQLPAAQENMQKFLTETASAFPLHTTYKIPASREWLNHPLQEIAPDSFLKASEKFASTSGPGAWNRLTTISDGSSTLVMVLLSPYPGWNALSVNREFLSLKPLSSLFYMLELPTKDGMTSPVRLIFAPFSIRLGLFVTLISGVFIAQWLCRGLEFNVFQKMKMDKK